MALAKMVDKVFTGNAEIGKNTHADIIVRNHKAAWVGGVMVFRERSNQQICR